MTAQVTPEIGRDFMARAKRDPVWWIETVLGQEQSERQVEMAEAVRDDEQVAIKSCHASGKTFEAGSLALWFVYSHPNSLCLLTAPTHRQMLENAYQELTKAHNAAKLPLGGDLLKNGRLRLGPRWGVIGFATDKPINFSGFHAADVLIIVDEASGVEDGLFQAIEGLKSSGRVKILLLSQGTQTAGEFYNAFQRDTALWRKITISAFDTPNFQEDVVARWLGRPFTYHPDANPVQKGQQLLDAYLSGTPTGNDDWPKQYLVNPAWACKLAIKSGGVETDPYLIRVLGEFPSGDPHALISVHLFSKAVVRKPDRPEASEVWMGLDVARFGDDDSTLHVRRQSTVMLYQERHGHDTVEVSRWAAEVARTSAVTDINVDVVGVGAGVADQLRHILPGVRIHDVNAGGSPRDKERFLNVRAEALWGLRERFQAGEISLVNLDNNAQDRLSPELTGIKWHTTPSGKVQIESKDEYKKRLGHSPDAADSLTLAFYKVNDDLLIFSAKDNDEDLFWTDGD